MNLKILIGSGDKIMLLTLPFAVLGLILNIIYPSTFYVGGPQYVLAAVSVVILIPGIIIWLWAVVLILNNVPQKRLITRGPYHLVRHPIYTTVAVLVVPWIGFLLNSWVGVPIAIVLYASARIYSGEEEKMLSKIFGSEWDTYCNKVLIPWL